MAKIILTIDDRLLGLVDLRASESFTNRSEYIRQAIVRHISKEGSGEGVHTDETDTAWYVPSSRQEAITSRGNLLPNIPGLRTADKLQTDFLPPSYSVPSVEKVVGSGELERRKGWSDGGYEITEVKLRCSNSRCGNIEWFGLLDIKENGGFICEGCKKRTEVAI